jgi:large subunit ribosomal protein L21
MYAIIKEGGGQRRVTKDEVCLIDLIEGGESKPGKSITFDQVLVIGGADGQAAKIGQPFIAGASVTAEVIEPAIKDEKLVIWHFGAKKGWRRKKGHRQQYTKVKITGIKG